MLVKPIYNYTYPIFKRAVTSLVRDIKLSSIEYDLIVGIGRGSCSLAQVLSHKLNIELKILNWSRDGEKVWDAALQEDIMGGKKVLLVDEIIDTGDTLFEVLETLKAPRECWKDVYMKVDIATLVICPGNRYGIYADFFHSVVNRNKTKRYIKFWWENDSKKQGRN